MQRTMDTHCLIANGPECKPALAMMMAQAASAAVAVFGGVLSDYRLLSFCIAGAVFGSFVDIAVSPPKQTGTGSILRTMAVRFLASAFTAVCITPFAIRHAISKDWVFHEAAPEAVLLSAFFFALVGVATIRLVVPLFTRWAAARAAKRLEVLE